MATFEHPIKCMGCGLHFIALSWNRYWPAQDEEVDPVTVDVHCPECGSTSNMRFEARKTDQEIFETVPGSSALVSTNFLPFAR